MNFIVLLFLAFYGVVATPINTANDNHRIVGGFDARPNQFPYQASIRDETKLEFFGSGSIISNQWILTTADTATFLQIISIRIVVGSIYLDRGGTIYTVVYALPHPDFNPTRSSNDIGLLRIRGQIIFNEFVQPIALFSGVTPVDLPLTVSGWGSTSTWNGNLSNTLQFVNLRVKDQDDCIFPMPDSLMCTGRFNPTRQGLCRGDVGNPLVYKGQLHGISVGSVHCLLYPLPDTHIRVAFFRNWIKEITNV